MSLDDEARAELLVLEAAHRLRVPRVVDGRQGPRIVIDGRDVLNLSSNDYLGLAGDPRLAHAAASAAEAHGVGSGASRLVTGTQRAHVALERVLADWLRIGAVQLFNSGYAANVGTLSALLKAGDVVFSDELNHASIIDGCRLSRADVVVFPHRDMRALERALVERVGRRRLVVSETLFSMDGDLADVAALAELCRKHDAALMLDEAHALGARGPEGRGVAAVAGITPDLLVGTCGKALGGFGAFVATTPAIAGLLWNRARSLVFSTALPGMVCAAIVRAVEIVRGSEGEDRRQRLARHARAVRARVEVVRGNEDSAIVPAILGDDREAMRVSSTLLDAGVLAQAIRPPTVPVGTARLRVALSSQLTSEHIEIACEEINNAMRRST